MTGKEDGKTCAPLSELKSRYPEMFVDQDPAMYHSPTGCTGHCDPALIGPSEHGPHEERESQP